MATPTTPLDSVLRAQVGSVMAIANARVKDLKNDYAREKLHDKVLVAGSFGLLGIPQKIILNKSKLDALMDENNYFWSQSVMPLATEISAKGTMTVDGTTRNAQPGEVAEFLKVVQGRVAIYSETSRLASEFSVSATIGKIFVGVAEALLRVAQQMGEVIKALLDAAVALVKGVAKTIETGGDILGYLPWIIAVLVLGPPLIRIFTADKGSLLKTAGSELDSGRRAAWTGAKAAGGAAAGAARKYASGGLLGRSRRTRRLRA